jgi:hypothetical protein
MNVNALVLYTNGKYAEIVLRSLGDYQKIVKGNIEWVPIVNDAKVTCYVNEEGACKGLPQNPWSPFLKGVGVILYNGAHVLGNIILLGEATEDGDDSSIGRSIVEKAEQFFK